MLINYFLNTKFENNLKYDKHNFSKARLQTKEIINLKGINCLKNRQVQSNL
jgi:hypothetical protein